MLRKRLPPSGEDPVPPQAERARKSRPVTRTRISNLVLFESAVFDSDPIGQGYANYDVSLDGKRFLMIRSHNGNH